MRVIARIAYYVIFIAVLLVSKVYNVPNFGTGTAAGIGRFAVAALFAIGLATLARYWIQRIGSDRNTEA